MRDGIKACPNNWQNCIIWVQDIVSPHINITAEISKPEVDKFVRMCQLFSEHAPAFYDDHNDGLTSIEEMPIQDRLPVSELLRFIEERISLSQSTEFLQPRQHAEREILSELTKFVQEFDPSLTVQPFGSTIYGIRHVGANFNLLIITSKFMHVIYYFCVKY